MENKIFELINNSNSILILTHENPDGDAVGSALAIYNFLSSINKSVDMLILDVPNTFNFLPSINKVVDKSNKIYDLGIVVDCSSIDRIGQSNNEFNNCKNTICIDHHLTNTNFCNINMVNSLSSSCSQVLYYLFKDLKISITKEIGISLATGLLTDTNGFKNSNIDSKSFQMVMELIDNEIDISDIYNKVLCKKSIAQHELMKIAIKRLELYDNGKIAFSYITSRDMKKVGAKNGDHEGLVEIGRDISGVMVSVFIRVEDSVYISLRSNGLVDVSIIAQKFGGGGHKMAAGAKCNLSFKKVKKELIGEIVRSINI